MWPRLRELMGDFTVAGLRSDPAGRSLCHQGLPAGRRRAGRRCLCVVLSRRRHRRPQGAGRRRAALQRPHPALARDTGHGRGENRGVLRRSGQAGLRCPERQKSISRSDRTRSIPRCTGPRCASPSSRRIGAEACCGAQCRRRNPPAAICTTRRRTDVRRHAGARRAGAQIALRSLLFLDAEPDHRSVIDAVALSAAPVDVQRRRALEIVGAIAERQFRRRVEPV